MDGGHQAIAFDPETRQPRIIGNKCVGCHLCRLVCPTGAIGISKRVNKKGLLTTPPVPPEAVRRHK